MHDDDAIGDGDFLAMPGHNRIEFGVLPEFLCGE